MMKEIKVRDLANECSGPGYEYLGHMQDPEILRKGHNNDVVPNPIGYPGEPGASESPAWDRVKGWLGLGGGDNPSTQAAPSGAPSPKPKK